MKTSPAGLIAELVARAPRPGRIEWIGLRVRARGPMHAVARVTAIAGRGLEGDHRAARPGSARQVSLIQHEHLPVVATLVGRGAIDPGLLRRNLVVSGINLVALRERPIRVGGARLVVTGPCHPCSRMEAALGEGGYHAMRGHGGMVAEVVEAGTIAVGDLLTPDADAFDR